MTPIPGSGATVLERAGAEATRFFFVRHGETDWNRDGRLQGQRDIPLNGRGRDQAAAAGRTLRDLLAARGLDPARLAFVASPLGRARDTMERLRRAMGLEPTRYTLDDRLKEIAFGAWEGLTWDEVETADPERFRARKWNKWTHAAPDGESYADVAARLRPLITELPRDAVVVAHGGVARAFLTELTSLDVRRAPAVEIVQGRVLIFADGRGDWA